MRRQATARSQGKTKQGTAQTRPGMNPHRLTPPVTGIATVTSKGQITLPKAVRDHYALRPGDQVEFVEQERGFRMTRRVKPGWLDEWVGYAKDLRGEDVDALVDEMRGR